MMKPVLHQTFTEDLTSDPLSFEFTAPHDLELIAVLIRISAAITETIVVTDVAIESASYDTVIQSTTLSAAQDFVFRPSESHVFRKGEKIKVTCTNATTTGSLFGRLKFRELG